MKLKPRPQYLSKLVAAQDNSLIKVITGMRRCGKSSLLTLFRQHLLQQGIAEDHIIMMNLESFQYSSFTFEDLHNANLISANLKLIMYGIFQKKSEIFYGISEQHIANS